MIHFSRDEAEESVDALERASLLVPLRPPARVCLGHAYGRIGRTRLACDLLELLIGDESLSVRLLLQVASGLDAVNAPASAMRACRVAALRDPGRAQTYYDMGYYSARMGASSQMVESLARKAISLDPTCVNYRVGLASLLIRQNRKQEALHLVQSFDETQIGKITCRCCLERVAELFESCGDFERSRLCHEQSLLLEFRGKGSDCCD